MKRALKSERRVPSDVAMARFAYWPVFVAALSVLSPENAKADPNGAYGDHFGFDEVRIGAFAHQIENSPGEEGVDLNLELLFDNLPGSYENRIVNHFLTPRPHIGASINLNDDTSQAYFGVTWDIDLTDRLFFETSFGGAFHDGPLTDDDDGDDEESFFGCTLNFRESASLGYRITPNLNVLLTIDHMSNAGICEENRGLTNAGVRLGYKW